MAPCKKITLERRTKKHPSGVVSRKKCLIGKKLQKLPAVKAWSRALREVVGFKKGEFAKIPKKGSVKYKAVKACVNSWARPPSGPPRSRWLDVAVLASRRSK